MSFALSKRSKERMVGVHPYLVLVANRAIQITQVDFGIPQDGGVRTAERQRVLFDDKASKCDGTVKKSYHQSARALDFYAYVDGKASWDKGHLAQVAAACLQAAIELDIDIEWGGLWNNFPDFPHIQLKK